MAPRKKKTTKLAMHVGPDVLAEIQRIRNEFNYHDAQLQSLKGQYQALLAVELVKKRNHPMERYDICADCGAIYERGPNHKCDA